MIKVGSKVRLKDSYIVEYPNKFIVEKITNNTCTIFDGKERYVAFIESLELIQEENKIVVFTGKEIELDNKIGATAKIYYGFDEKKKKYICVEICANTIIKTFFEDLQDVNVFLKSLGFKEVIQEKFDLVKFLKENLKPKEFEAGEYNNYFYFNMKDNEWYVSYNHYFQEIKTYFSNINYDFVNTLNENKVTPKELKEAYKELGWL